MPNIGSLLLALALGTCVASLALAAPRQPPAEPAEEAAGAVADARRVGAIEPQIDRWNRFLEETRGRADAVERIEAYRKEHGVPLSFWEPEEESRSAAPRYVTSHPCGENATLFVDRMPDRDAAVVGDTVFELDEAGKTLREWIIPSDTRVEAVEGKEVLVPLTFWRVADPDPEPGLQVDVLLAIRPDGRFRVLPPRHFSDPETRPCSPNLPESAYWTCWTYKDLEGGKARSIAYEGPCT